MEVPSEEALTRSMVVVRVSIKEDVMLRLSVIVPVTDENEFRVRFRLINLLGSVNEDCYGGFAPGMLRVVVVEDSMAVDGVMRVSICVDVDVAGMADYDGTVIKIVEGYSAPRFDKMRERVSFKWLPEPYREEVVGKFLKNVTVY